MNNWTKTGENWIHGEQFKRNENPNLIQICRREGDDVRSDGTVLVDCRAVGQLGEDGRVVVGVHDRHVHGGVVAEGRAAAVPRLDGQEVLPGALKVDIPGHGDEAAAGVDGELAVLVAADDGVGDLGVDSDVSGGGQHPHHVRADVHPLRDGGEVIFARKLGWIVIHVCNQATLDILCR